MIRRGVAAALIAVALGGGLAACGKRGSLEPPEGEESAYTYPHVYPKPESVTPADEPEARPRTLEAPSGAGGITVFPTTGRTTTYGQPVPQ